MRKNTLTTEPQKAISAAFDSVNLINKLIVLPIDDKKKSDVERNVKHLELMLTKQTFLDNLTPTQKSDIETCISAGNGYIGTN